MVSIQVVKERREAEKAVKDKMKTKMKADVTTKGKSVVKTKMSVDPVHRWIIGWSKDGKVQYGPDHECWQCMHRARGGAGGHKHSCGKLPYVR